MVDHRSETYPGGIAVQCATIRDGGCNDGPSPVIGNTLSERQFRQSLGSPANPCRTSHRLVLIVIARYRFIYGIALYAKAGVRALIDDSSHSLRVTRVASNRGGGVACQLRTV